MDTAISFLKTLRNNFPLLLLVAAIGLSPRFLVGRITGRSIEIRVEDLVLVVLCIAWVVSMIQERKTRVAKPPLALAIIAWMSIVVITTLVNVALANVIPARAFFYTIKEVEFFVLYFYLFYHMKTREGAKMMIALLVALGAINAGWVMYQLAMGISVGGSTVYGPTAIVEPTGPLPSGGFFLLLFTNLFNIFLFYYLTLRISPLKKIILGLLCVAPMIGVISSGSRTSLLSLALVIFLTLLFYQIKRGGLKTAVASVALLIVLGGTFLYLANPKRAVRTYPLSPSAILLGLEGGREFVWEGQINEFVKHSPWYAFLGLGRSVSLYAEESHSEYVRNFVETGIIGSVAFLILLIAILKRTFHALAKAKDPLVVGLASGLFVSTIAMIVAGIAVEIFFSVKIDEVYWSFAALTMAIIALHEASFKKSQ